MDAAGRLRIVRMIEKMNANKDFAKKIGLRDVSVFREPENKNNRL